MQEAINELRDVFINQLSILKEVCKSNLKGRAHETRIMMASACTTGSAICELSNKLEYYYTEMIMLSRSVIEKLINYCYLQLCSDDEYTRFMLHPFYKLFHNSNRTKHAGKDFLNIKYSGQEDLKQNPQVTQALKLFSETNPRMDWSNMSIDKKVTFIVENSDLEATAFLMNTLTINSNASEALHGSLYGCAIGTGAYNIDVDTANPNNVTKYILQNASLLFVQIDLIITELIRLLSKQNDLDLLLVRAKKNQQTEAELLKKMFW